MPDLQRIDLGQLRYILNRIHGRRHPIAARKIAAELGISIGTLFNTLNTAERDLKVRVARYPKKGLGPEVDLGLLDEAFLRMEPRIQKRPQPDP